MGASVTQISLGERLKKIAEAKVLLIKLKNEKGSKKTVKKQEEFIEDEMKHLEDIIDSFKTGISN